MESIEVAINRDPGPMDRRLERFYVSTVRHRLWRFFIPPAGPAACAWLVGDHPATWIALGFFACWILFWTKAYIRFHRALQAAADPNAPSAFRFVATPVGFAIHQDSADEPKERDGLIGWSELSRFSESKHFFAFTIQGFPTFTVGKRHFTGEEASYVRQLASHAGHASGR